MVQLSLTDVQKGNVITQGDHLAKCRAMPLGRVPFTKVRNLVHFVDFSSLEGATWSSDHVPLVQVPSSTWAGSIRKIQQNLMEKPYCVALYINAVIVYTVL